jgi:cytochrome P450
MDESGNGLMDDPFADARRKSGILVGDFDGEIIPMILRYRDIRRAAKDWQIYSSDSPFRVPIPSEENVRNVRQLPIETNPPLHSSYRALVAPLFRRPSHPDYIVAIESLVDAAIDDALARPSIDVMRDFALPMQCRALTHLLGLPLKEAEEWVSWGEHVFRDSHGQNAEKGQALSEYIRRALDRAQSSPGNDLFSILNSANIDGRPLTREEATGFASLAFAGGRDTIINMITGTLALLAKAPEHINTLRSNPKWLNTAAEELLRVLSPLTHIGRVCPQGVETGDMYVKPGARISLCWASANRDETVFDNADTIRLDRNPNPHVAFGSGPHTCLGAVQARVILRSLLKAVSSRVARLEILEEAPSFRVWPHYRRQMGYASLNMTFHKF